MVKVIALCLALSGCVSAGGNFCAIESPKRYTPAQIETMGPEVKRDVLAHNEKGEKLCGWKANGDSNFIR